MASRTLAIVLAATVALGGCGGATTLLGRGATQVRPTTTTVPATPQASTYLAQLSSEQAMLAAAEHRIPRQARTPRALAHTIALLHSAIGRLSSGLAAVRPPRAVLGLHRRLVNTVRNYARQLAHAENIAGRPAGELQAVNLLSVATERATRAFAATIAAIDRRLTR